MALEDSRDKRPHADDLGQSFEAHSGNVGSAFEERNASPELLVHRKSHTVVWVIVAVLALVAFFLVYYLTKPKTPPGGAAGAQGRGQNGPAAITVGQTTAGNINMYVDGAGHGDAGGDGDAVQPDYGRGDGGALSRGPDRAQGRSAGGHRSAAVPGDADAGRRRAGTRPGRAGAGGDGFEALPGGVCDATRSRSSSWTTRKRPSCSTRAR